MFPYISAYLAICAYHVLSIIAWIVQCSLVSRLINTALSVNIKMKLTESIHRAINARTKVNLLIFVKGIMISIQSDDGKYLIKIMSENQSMTCSNKLDMDPSIESYIGDNPIKYLTEGDRFSNGYIFGNDRNITFVSPDILIVIRNDTIIIKSKRFNVWKKGFKSIVPTFNDGTCQGIMYHETENSIQELEINDNTINPIISCRYLARYPVSVMGNETTLDVSMNLRTEQFSLLDKTVYCFGSVNYKGKQRDCVVVNRLKKQNILKNTEHVVRELFQKRYGSIDNIINRCIGCDPKSFYVSSEDIEQYILEPITDIFNRPFKGWRSSLFFLFCSLFNVEIEKYKDISILFEILQTGSLIIDDIEDESLLRRGDACTYIKYGLPTAINSGNLAYYLCEDIFQIFDNDSTKVKMFNMYTKGMLTLHIGQGLDIKGLHHVLKQDEKPLHQTLLDKLTVIHTLKTATFISTVISIACIIANVGKDTERKCMLFAEKLGLGFQIIDDVLTLDGSMQKNDWKEFGDDIKQGKITYPFIYALKYLNNEKSTELIKLIINHRNLKHEDILRVSDLISETPALKDCRDVAHHHLETGIQSLMSIPNKSIHLFAIIELAKRLIYR